MGSGRKKIVVNYFRVISQCLSADSVKRHKNSIQSIGSKGRHLNPGQKKHENAVTSIGTKRGIGGWRRTVMRRLTTGIRSEKCVVRRFRRRKNVIECTYTNLDTIA
jgi:hypothetical protein